MLPSLYRKPAGHALLRWLLASMLVLVAWPVLTHAQIDPRFYPPGYSPYGFAPPPPQHSFWWYLWHNVGSLLGYGILGGLIGAFFSQKLKPYRRYVWRVLGGLLLLRALFSTWPISPWLNGAIGFVAGVILGYLLLMVPAARRRRDTTLGSAEWADLSHLDKNDLLANGSNTGLFLGDFADEKYLYPLFYKSNRHLLTVAPTRSGKGTSAIIPNLLMYEGSALVIDPKGENALITAARRGSGDRERGIPAMGQKTYVVDPWGITGIHP